MSVMQGAIKRLRRSRVLATAIAIAALIGLATTALAPQGSRASSHREAPLVSADPQVDNTDVYAFVSPDDPETVTLISNWIPFQEPAGGPNFYSWGAQGVRYEINIDNDHDAQPDIIYRWVFTNHRRRGNTFLYNTGPVTSLTDPDLNFFQTYDLRKIVVGRSNTRLVNDKVAVPSHVGDASMPDFAALSAQGVKTFGGDSSKTWAGQADDSFFLDLRVFDLLYGADFSEVGDDTLAGFNVSALALQVPKAELARRNRPGNNPIIGVWSSASRRRPNGEFAQVSRLGNPLVNEVVIPLRDKDRWNRSAPRNDGQFLSYVTDPELPKLIEAIYGIDAPATPRNDLVSVFLTGVQGLNKPANVRPSEQIRLNMSIPPCEEGTCPAHSPLGVIGGDNAGYPNGRRLADDTIDISLQVVEGELVGNPNDLGDGVDANELAFQAMFPYLAVSHSGSDTDPHTP
jgi:Domain of unknown function (DUF4331)